VSRISNISQKIREKFETAAVYTVGIIRGLGAIE